MPSAENAKIQIEAGQTLNDYAAMTDAGDHLVFTISGGTVWSGKSGYAPIVRPNGISSGLNLISIAATNDQVNVAAFSAYCKGSETDVNAALVTFGRPTSAGVSKVTSITMASDGSLAAVEGTEGASAAFSETRDAAGGPPLIPVNSIELGQVRVVGATSGAPTADEIKQVRGQHAEYANYPVWDEFPIGKGQSADSSAEKNAHIKFASALPQAHTGPASKGVYIRYYAPVFSEVQRAMGFVPAENSHTLNTQEYYRGSIASVASALGQGGFTALLDDGVTDTLVTEKDQILNVKFYPDENKSAYILTQGKIGLRRTYPEANQIQAEVTVSAESESAEFAS